MYTYMSVPVLLVVAFAIKRHRTPTAPVETEIDIDYYIKQVEPYSEYNPELFKEYVNNLELFHTTKVIDYLKYAVKNIEKMELYAYTDDDFEELNLENVSDTLKKLIN